MRQSALIRTVSILAISVGSSLVLVEGSSAAVFHVDAVLDEIDDHVGDGVCHTASNTCTLRAAVMEANESSASVAIVLPRGTYRLTRQINGPNGDDEGDLNLVTPVSGTPQISIFGAGRSSTIIDAGQIDRVLWVGAARYAYLEGVTLRNGFAGPGFLYGNYDGGGILNIGHLTLAYSAVSGNSTLAEGGGISNDGYLVLDYCTVTGNQAAADGGGIATAGFANQGFFTHVEHSTISRNASYSNGGGIYTQRNSVTIVDSTVSQNAARQNGGGVYNDAEGSTRLFTATIAWNEADSDADPDGGIGGGIYNSGSAAQFQIENTVVAGNNRSGVPEYDDCAGGFSLFFHSAFGTRPDWCVLNEYFGAGFDLIPLAGLGTLRANGGPTETVALLALSPLIDDSDPTVAICKGADNAPMPFDQRGGPRVVGVRCDVGAFEYGALPAGLIFAGGFERGNFLDW